MPYTEGHLLSSYVNNNLLSLHEGIIQLAYAILLHAKTLGPEHPDLVTRLNNLANLYQTQGKYEQAESLFQRAIGIYQQTFGPDHPGTKTIKENYARFQEEKKRKRR